MVSLDLGLALNDLPIWGDHVDVVAALHRYNLYLFPPTAVLPTIRNTYTGALIQANGVSHVIDCLATPASNKVVEIGENKAATTDLMPASSMGWATHDLSCFWDTTVSGTPTGEAFVGIELGSIGANPPFPAAPSFPCLQVRINHTLQNWQLYSAVGDGVTPATIVNSSRGAIDFESKVRLVWKPGAYARAYFWNEVVAEITDPQLLPAFAGSQKCRAALIVSSGSSAWAPRFVASQPMLIMDTG